MRLILRTVVPRVLVTTIVLLAARSPAAAEKRPLTFERDIRPILRAHCFDCHGAAKEKKGRLDLRLRRLMVAGGESGPAIVPGKPGQSYLVKRVRAGEMPAGETRLTPHQIDTLVKWIAEGAQTARPEPDQIGPGIGITAEERGWWAFRPLVRPPVPATGPNARVRTPIDAFLAADLARDRLALSPDADRRTLARRAGLDLLGIPPEPEQLDRFIADPAVDAWERLLDRLLASPHYGERWGRHWLDVAGYADSEGYTNRDDVRSDAWKYRDYVIRAFNDNKPFDRFVIEQLAGDELLTPPYRNLDPRGTELMTATGFLRMAADGTGSGADSEVARNQVITDTITIVSTALMGVSLRCAQCHDHRYDPISQDDYYRVRAVFEPALNPKGWRTPGQRRMSLYSDADRDRAAVIEKEAKALDAEKNSKRDGYIAQALTKELMSFEEPLRGRLKAAKQAAADKRTKEQQALLKKYPKLDVTGGNLYQYNQKHADEIKEFDKRITAIRAKKPTEQFLRVLTEVPGQVPETRLFHRGDHRQPRDVVKPGGLTVTAPENQRLAIPDNAPDRPTTGRRLAFARWLTSGRHPLSTRALVNRVWLHHFGRGLVNSAGEFGKMGEHPTHPVLLDWLAIEFAESGWDLKHLHRLIMNSTVYRQHSARSPRGERVDPNNRRYWRKPLVRLDAEVIRDSMLSVTGKLNTRLYGTPIPVKEDAVGQIVIGIDKKAASNRPGPDVPLGAGGLRRSVYIQVRRSRPLAVLASFDAPVMETNCTRRTPSTSALQSLMLMNSKFILDHAMHFAQRLEAGVPDRVTLPPESADQSKRPAARQVAWAWQLAYGRDVTPGELSAAIDFLDRQLAWIKDHPEWQQTTKTPPATQALANLCQAVLGSNEFLYVD